MNSNLLLTLLAFTILSGCGVKANPLSPPETALKSYTDSYIRPMTDEEISKKLLLKKK